MELIPHGSHLMEKSLLPICFTARPQSEAGEPVADVTHRSIPGTNCEIKGASLTTTPKSRLCSKKKEIERDVNAQLEEKGIAVPYPMISPLAQYGITSNGITNHGRKRVGFSCKALQKPSIFLPDILAVRESPAFSRIW
jgi:hypothetical protein